MRRKHPRVSNEEEEASRSFFGAKWEKASEETSEGELSRAFSVEGKGVERGSSVQRRGEEASRRESIAFEKVVGESFK